MDVEHEMMIWIPADLGLYGVDYIVYKPRFWKIPVFLVMSSADKHLFKLSLC